MFCLCGCSDHALKACIDNLNDWVCTTRCQKRHRCWTRCECKCTLIVFPPVSSHIMEQLESADIPHPHSAIVSSRDNQMRLVLHRERSETAHWVCMADHWVDYTRRVQVKEFELGIFCSSDQHLVLRAYFNCIDLLSQDRLLRPCMPAMSHVIVDSRKAKVLDLVTWLHIEDRDDVLSVAHCEPIVTREPGCTRRREEVTKVAHLSEAPQ